MLPHQQRVVEEAEEVSGRAHKLRSFLNTPQKNAVDGEERNRMNRQLVLMNSLHDVLQDRINHFPKP